MNNPRYSGYQSGTAVSSAPALLGQVLGITGVGFLITALAAYIFRDVSSMVGTIAVFAGLAMIFVMRGVRRNPAVALLWFYAFTFVEGIGIAPIISHYTALAGSEVVVDAAATTGFGMLVLGGVAFTFSLDWRRFQGIAFGALLVLVLVGIASIFFHFINPGVYAWATLGIFTLLTLVDFSRIRAGGDGLTPVDLAVSIYLDGLNIFIALLELFGMRSRED
jgi:modulator of FtsH protease